MKQSILFGNGFNRLNEENPSWNDLIKSISNTVIKGTIPNPTKYEAILLKDYQNSNWGDDDNIQDTINNAKKKQESDLKHDIAKKLESFKSNSLYGKILDMPFEHFMTTNYDNLFIKDLDEKLFVPNDITEKLYSIRRSYIIKSEENESKGRYYWPIHGYYKNPSSIMLGYDQYCGSLAKLDSFVKGDYKKDMGSIKQRLEDGSINDVKSWVDLFFISDVHIIGLGLDYEEIDLWWILNRRKRIMSHTNLNNNIYYYQINKEDDEKEQIFKIFGVEFVPLDKELFKDDNYIRRYEAQLNEIITRMNDRWMK